MLHPHPDAGAFSTIDAHFSDSELYQMNSMGGKTDIILIMREETESNLALYRVPIDFGGNANYGHIKMPQPQYLGAKHKLLPWIMGFVPPGGGAALDGFGGSQSVAFEMKKAGYAVHTCDFLCSCHQGGLALVENIDETLRQGDLELLFSDNPNRGDVMLKFEDVFFTKEECVVLDNFRANADKISSLGKRALALAAMCRSLTRKTIMGHFAHLRAMEYARNPIRVRRNPSIARRVRDLFLQLVPQYNAAIFDNGRANKSHRANILDILPKLASKIDLAYYDPPYCKSHADYQAFYHLLETFVENWRDKKFINGNRRYHPPRYSGFDKVGEVAQSFRRLFALSDEIPQWLISYNDRSVPPVDVLVKMASRHKKVRVEENTYQTSRGGKGSVAGSREYLLICE